MAIEATSFIVLEDGTRKKGASAGDVFEGQPVKLNSAGELEPGLFAVTALTRHGMQQQGPAGDCLAVTLGIDQAGKERPPVIDQGLDPGD